ncbi:hypothetical protein GCM10011320_22110 [Neoroseomonas lacus]|uniref:Uncharacterized protein n=1 Tax=Neoroseomonas lacus TaxID=287609 RepID=A0A917KHW9_9PROT|nr:hypothetical protein GCM10011320_22110 [Neoroseomonas lacus]
MIPAGTLISVTSRDAESLSVWGTYRALQAIDPTAARAAWIDANPGQGRSAAFREDKFLMWLVESGALAPEPSWDWMLAVDGNMDEMWLGAGSRAPV